MSERRMITHLNHVPAWLLDEARSLESRSAARSLLMSHTNPECWEYLKPFIEDVVFGSEPAASWLRGQVLVPDWSLQDQLTLSRSELLAPIGGAFTQRIVPDLDDWKDNVSWIGAPALALPDADYRYRVPADSVGLGNAAMEEVTNSTVAVRRWIAARIAQVVKDSVPTDLIEMIRLLKNPPTMDEWSDDARHAASALIREYQQMGQYSDTVPGMRGPDDWYR